MRNRTWLVATLSIIVGATLVPTASGQDATPLAKDARLDAFGDPLPEGVLYRLGTPRLRHYALSSVEFSGNGKYLYSISRASDMRVWDAGSGKLIGEIPGSYRY